MLDAIKGIFSSKKFYLTVIGTAIIYIMNEVGLPAELVTTVAGLFGVNVLSQGVADNGKEAAKIANGG